MSKFCIKILFVLLFITSCNKGNDLQAAKQITKPIENTKVPSLLDTNLEVDWLLPTKISEATIISKNTINPLSGLMIDKSFLNKRPFSVVFNNLKKALPQSGISEADLYYEVLAEAGITRIIGTSQTFTADKIGPIRSTRDYFLNFALDNDSIFVHHGGSVGGYNFIKSNGINNLDGMSLEGIIFYRDKERARQRGLEHSSYTSGEDIVIQAEKYGYNLYHNKDFVSNWNFSKDDYDLETESTSSKIIVPYSEDQIGTFDYNSQENIYYRSQNNEPHMDEYFNKQLTVKNVLVQFVNMTVIDNEGRRKVDLVSSGYGYYFTNGKHVAVKWSKENHFSPTKWFYEDGVPLILNKGKTWICVVQRNTNLKIEK